MINKKEVKRRLSIDFDIEVWTVLKDLQKKTYNPQNIANPKKPIKHIIQDAIRVYARMKSGDATFSVEDYMEMPKDNSAGDSQKFMNEG